MIAYRYLDPRWALDFAEGKLRINSLDYFRRMEGPQGDALDSAVQNTIDQAIYEDARGDPILERMGIKISGDGPAFVQVGNTSMVAALPGAALCFCQIGFSAAFPGKTAVFEVSDMTSFAEIATNAASGRLGARFEIAKIEYASRVFDPRKGFGSPSAFHKSIAFASEAEVRIYWPDCTGDHVDIDAPELSSLIARVA
jgi:hypothetical protein